jgi:hypothetical protein
VAAPGTSVLILPIEPIVDPAECGDAAAEIIGQQISFTE